MRILDSNIDGTATARTTAGSSLAAFGFIAIAAGLLPTVGIWSGIDGALNNGRRSLSLHLRDCLDDVLGLGDRNSRWLERGHLHKTGLRLTPTNTKQFSHMRNEEMVKYSKLKIF